MPDEEDYKDYKTVEDYLQSREASRYYHDLYLKAVNHPVRREMLKIIKEKRRITRKELLKLLTEAGLIKDDFALQYNIDFLTKALCVKSIEEGENIIYEITQAGKVIDFLK